MYIGVQAGSSELIKVKPNQLCSYSRINTLLIKKELEKQITSPDYWDTLRAFIYTPCSRQAFEEKINRYLPTPEGKKLHNQLISAIIYNAHFSTSPPPNVEIPEYIPPKPVPRPIPKNISKNPTSNITFSAAELRHLPSISQLSQHFDFLLKTNNIQLEIPPKIKHKTFTELKKFILKILKDSSSLLTLNGYNQPNPKITTEQIIYVIHSIPSISSIVSSSVITKYSE